MDTQIATRSVQRVVTGMPTSDGPGVRLTRVIGQPQLPDLDPFLMLDEFGTDKPEDYIAGFPDHPHRGFETVTYMLDGRMRHRDNHGNEGVLVPGSVQWMTAGRGLVHSEMPEQQAGRMRGFQLWLNLPAREKMTAPKYQEFGPERIPSATPAAGVTVKGIAGSSNRRSPTFRAGDSDPAPNARQSRTSQLLLRPNFDQRLIRHIPGVRSRLDGIKKVLRQSQRYCLCGGLQIREDSGLSFLPIQIRR